MTLQIPITPETEARLRERAAVLGQDLITYAASLLEHSVEQPMPLADISGPLADEFRRSGMTEEDLSTLLEQAKHDARARRRSS